MSFLSSMLLTNKKIEGFPTKMIDLWIKLNVKAVNFLMQECLSQDLFSSLIFSLSVQLLKAAHLLPQGFRFQSYLYINTHDANQLTD